MKPGVIVKNLFFVAILVASSGLFGIICGQVYRRYLVLFFPGPKLLEMAAMVFGGMVLVAVAAGLLVALVRPFGVIVVGFVLSALAMVLAWQINVVSLFIGVFYVILGTMYAYSVVRDLNGRVSFSVHPISERQGVLLFGPVLLVSMSLALGYQDDASRTGTLVPTEYKESAVKMVMGPLRARIEGEKSITADMKAAAVKEVEQEVERFWMGIENVAQPYAPFVPLGIALMMVWLLQTLLALVSWIPPLALSAIFSLFRRTGVTREVTDTREVRQLVLA